MFFLKALDVSPKIKFGDDNAKDTPVPIPNTTVKLCDADGTAGEALWKSRELPDNKG